MNVLTGTRQFIINFSILESHHVMLHVINIVLKIATVTVT